MSGRHFLLTYTSCLLFKIIHVAFSASIPVIWSTKFYGPDGPWQAVKIRVGGGVRWENMTIDDDFVELDLLPGGDSNTNILTSEACAKHAVGTCGKGGTWNPIFPAGVKSTSGDHYWKDDANQVNSLGLMAIPQAIVVGKFLYPNSSLALMERITITDPNGNERGPELGTFALGGPKQVQEFDAEFYFSDSSIPLTSFNFAGGAYNRNWTKSYSYGLHIGSALHKYTGSLIFGGYDKGRLIGPYARFDKAIELVDISIGVATGGSPWDFKEKTGILVNNSSQLGTSISVLPDSRQTYLHLPLETCNSISRYIPIKFDQNLAYWVWNTEDPFYKTIVSSPAYLGFTFRSASSASENITIKVPFSLLNLTLDVPITKMPTVYFPCQPYSPQAGQPYILGRAFLQAAFIGRNWNRNVSWLAQAPGPGKFKNGLGNVTLDIDDLDTDLPEVYNNASLFTESWANYWTPLPVAGDKHSQNGDQSTAKLSPGAKVGIGLGVTAAVLLAIGATILFLRKRRNACIPEAGRDDEPEYVIESKTQAVIAELEHPPAEIYPNANDWTYELETPIAELDCTAPRQPSSSGNVPLGEVFGSADDLPVLIQPKSNATKRTGP